MWWTSVPKNAGVDELGHGEHWHATEGRKGIQEREKQIKADEKAAKAERKAARKAAKAQAKAESGEQG